MSCEPAERAIRAILSELQQSELYRSHRVVTHLDATHVLWEGRRYVNFASNDYLGLTHHPRVIRAAADAIAREGAGSAASALVTGYGPTHASAEQHIARWKGTESCVLLPSGYQANHAALQTFAAIGAKTRSGIRFLLDKLCHASLIDAIRAAGADFRIFPHDGIDKVRRLLAQAEPGQLQVVVTESIFSMDGDAADLLAIARLKGEHPFMLLLDEAHASGVYGRAGAGLAEELGLSTHVDVTIVTLSKSIGCAGGAVCGSQVFCDALVNLGRAYIFSTSLAPAMAAAADAAISVMQDEPQRQQRVRQFARQVRQELRDMPWPLAPGDSPVIPLVLGSAAAALKAAEHLISQGLMVIAIRPPSVPKGASRLRITLSSEHTDEEIARLLAVVRELPALLAS